MTTPRKRYRIVNLTDGTVWVDAHMTLSDALTSISQIHQRRASSPAARRRRTTVELMLVPEDDDPLSACKKRRIKS